MDKLVWDNQIGKLGDRTERNLYYSDVKLPIFEIRDIAGVSSNKLVEKLTNIEKAIKKFHEQGSRSVEKRQHAHLMMGKKACKLQCKTLAGIVKPCETECKNNEARGQGGKCQDCGRGKQPNIDRTGCVFDGSDCQLDEIKGATKCEKCPPGKIPDARARNCIERDPNKGKKQGKCPTGKILDPVQGGQDENTNNPICIDDDDKRCPPDQVAETRKKNKKNNDNEDYKPTCAAQNPADNHFDCDNKPGTYHHKEKAPGKDQMSNSCRSTRKKEEEKKSKYQERVKTAGPEVEKKKTDKRDTRRRARMGSCMLAIAEVGALAADISQMTSEELEGAMELWPEGENLSEPLDDGTVPDHVIEIAPRRSVVTIERRRPFRLPGNFGKLLTGVGKGAGGGSAASNSIPKAARQFKKGNQGRAPASSVNIARASKAVGEIIKDKKFVSCLATAAIAAGGQQIVGRQENKLVIEGTSGTMNIDWSRKPIGKPLPEDKLDSEIKLKYSSEEDWGTSTLEYTTFTDMYVRDRRVQYETCFEPRGDFRSAEVRGGCCAFYGNKDCTNYFFKMENRQHADIKKEHRGVNGIWCTFQADCVGGPLG